VRVGTHLTTNTCTTPGVHDTTPEFPLALHTGMVSLPVRQRCHFSCPVIKFDGGWIVFTRDGVLLRAALRSDSEQYALSLAKLNSLWPEDSRGSSLVDKRAAADGYDSAAKKRQNRAHLKFTCTKGLFAWRRSLLACTMSLPACQRITLTSAQPLQDIDPWRFNCSPWQGGAAWKKGAIILGTNGATSAVY
jgi:hypothetical protein